MEELTEQEIAELKSGLEFLKKMQMMVSKTELISWFNENDVEYTNMTDLDMYIYLIKNI